MAQIKFYVNTAGFEHDVETSGSGLGFYGTGGFGSSIAVGEYNENTYVTDGNGVTQGPQGNNVKWTHANSGEVEGAVNLNLLNIPNYQASLNIRFTHSSAVQVQNAELLIYDRTTTTSGASGVTTQIAELLHPSVSQTGLLGSGDSAWNTIVAGTSLAVSVAQSPGQSGLEALDGTSSTTVDDQHDWYIALSASPDSIGSKTQYALLFRAEYL